MLVEPPGGHDARSVQRIGTELLGSLLPLHRAGVIHVTAVHAHAGKLTTLRIGPSAPKSSHDFFVLCLVRAHADAIVSTLKNLRDEPALRFELLGDGSIAAGLRRYRSEVLGKTDPPRLLLLSRRGEVDLAHPALHGPARPTLVMPAAEASRMDKRLRAAGMSDTVDVWSRPSTSLRALVDELRALPGMGSVAMEAGPSTTRALYEAPSAVDALALCRFEGSALAPEVAGGEFIDEQTLRQQLPLSGGRTRITEPSGPWSFELRHRTAPPGRWLDGAGEPR